MKEYEQAQRHQAPADAAPSGHRRPVARVDTIGYAG